MSWLGEENICPNINGGTRERDQNVLSNTNSRQWQRKKKKQSQGVYYLILFICAVCLAYEPVAKILSDTRQKTSTPAKIELTAGTRLEIPAKLKNVPEQILQRKGYTVSYNKDLKIPNWVAWELTPEKLVERESRTDKFLPDPDLPEHEAVTTDDYKGAGMDRGHMCPDQ